MQYYLAPMEGLTGYVFRRVHARRYPGLDKYFTPFLSPVENRAFTTRDRNELLRPHNEGLNVVPQLLTRSADDLLWAAHQIAEMGYREINLNLGCPSKTVVSKGKGAGFLADPDGINALLERFFSADLGLFLSVKTRLGMEREEEFQEILEIYNRYPLSELIVHPRVQADLYKRPVHEAAFLQALANSRAPVCYNGDLFCREDVGALKERFPGLTRAMLGRGLLADPGLLCAMPDKNRLRAFHDDLLEGYSAVLSGDHNVLHRLKELWFYLRYSFVGCDKLFKRLRKANTLRDYQTVIDQLFAEGEVSPSPRFIAP